VDTGLDTGLGEGQQQGLAPAVSMLVPVEPEVRNVPIVAELDALFLWKVAAVLDTES
jgi:hypothetical protein